MTNDVHQLARHLGPASVVAGLWLLPALALGQQPMGQGEAAINVRSDVTMAIRGTRGTPKARLQALGEVVMGKMDDVRSCYRELVSKRPTTVGAFAVTVALDDGPQAKMSVEEQDGSDPQLKRCVMKRLATARFRRVPRPATAVVTLTFENSRAEGQAAFEQARATLADVQVSDGPEGGREASWTTADGRVRFVARAGTGKRRDEAVTAVIRAVREGFAGFLDCRRRASKRGMSPAGSIAATIRLRHGDRGDTKLGEITVAHQRVPNCVSRAFKKLRYPDAPAGARVDLTVIFAE